MRPYSQSPISHTSDGDDRRRRARRARCWRHIGRWHCHSRRRHVVCASRRLRLKLGVDSRVRVCCDVPRDMSASEPCLRVEQEQTSTNTSAPTFPYEFGGSAKVLFDVAKRMPRREMGCRRPAELLKRPACQVRERDEAAGRIQRWRATHARPYVSGQLTSNAVLAERFPNVAVIVARPLAEAMASPGVPCQGTMTAAESLDHVADPVNVAMEPSE